MYEYKAQVVDVIDGDSIVLNVDLGMGQWALAQIHPGGPRAKYPQGVYRLNGIDAPEMNTPEGKIARSRVLELIALNELGNMVRIQTYKEEKYGRYLVDLMIQPPARSGVMYPNTEKESASWLSDEALIDLYSKARDSGAPTLKALASELISLRSKDERRRLVNVNEQLVTEGHAKPYSGGAR